MTIFGVDPIVLRAVLTPRGWLRRGTHVVRVRIVPWRELGLCRAGFPHLLVADDKHYRYAGPICTCRACPRRRVRRHG